MHNDAPDQNPEHAALAQLNLWRQTRTGKFAGLALLAALFMIPGTMIQNLIDERSSYQQAAENNVANSWAGAQEIAGPILNIPYTEKKSDRHGNTEIHTGQLRLLPAQLKVDIKLVPERRYRGIFEVAVYQAELQLSGHFDLPTLAKEAPGITPRTAEAAMYLSLADLRGARSAIALTWGDTTREFSVSSASLDGFETLVETSLPIQLDDEGRFDITLTLAGSGGLHVLPLGDQSDIHIHSNWPNPKFSGDLLPTQRSINSNGFSAQWHVNQIGRGLPSWWLDEQLKHTVNSVDTSGFSSQSGAGEHLGKHNNHTRTEPSKIGVELVQPSGGYQRITRAVKYAFLFVMLAFATLFVFELLGDLRVHPVQYLFVGAAQTLFHLLLLALSEHTSFALAYLLASSACIALIVCYSAAILKAKRRSLALSGVLGLLYVFVFITLAAEDMALLMGSAALFIMLAAIMIASRRVDWYAPEKTLELKHE